MRMTLALNGDAFREGVFGWKGFLYYKWCLATVSTQVKGVASELDRLVTFGPSHFESQHAFQAGRARLKRNIAQEWRSVLETLRVYDDAFEDLTRHNRPAAFRAFLLAAPSMFVQLGEQIGGLSHIASFWRYRFPPRSPIRASLTDAVDLIADFEDSLSRAAD
jgi:hypothetical protein